VKAGLWQQFDDHGTVVAEERHIPIELGPEENRPAATETPTGADNF
jgi:hypothetical protein